MKTTLLVGLGALSVFAFAREARADLLFEDQGTQKLGTQPCGGGGCWTNYARIVDFDGDGNLDLVAVNCGGFFSNPTPQPLVLYSGDGAGSFADASAAIGNFQGGVRQVAFGDIDGDGDLDLYVPAAGQEQADALFVRDGGAFTNEAAARLPAGLSSDAGAARFGDFDNDGDLDIFVANGYLNDAANPALLYYNDGSGVFTAAPPGAVPTAKSGVNPDDVDLADFDGDFDLDVYINMHSGQNSLWLNNGDGTFTDASAGLPALGAGSNFHYGPAVCDIDNDGDRDILIDNTGGGYLEQVLINDGNGSFTDETSRISGNVSGADDNIVSCIDFDGDGDFDISVGALQFGSSGTERVFANDGAGNFTPVAMAFSSVADPTLWMEFGDLNGDGRLDAFTAQGEANPELERVYFGNMAVAIDTVPPQIVAQDLTNGVVRFAVRDNAVTDEGPRLRRAFLLVDGQEVRATHMGGDLYRAPVAPGATFTVCAEDWAGNLPAECGGGPSTTSSAASTGATSGSGAVTSGAGTSTGAGAGSGAGGADGDGGDDGCGCALPGSTTSGGMAGLAIGGVVVFGVRFARRRRSTGARR